MSVRVGAYKPVGLPTVELAQFFTRIFYRFVFQSLGFSTFFVKVLRRRYREIDLVYPKRPERLPVILSEEEVARLIESASTSSHRVILTTLYGAGLRREELCRLKVTDVDSQRMVLHVRQGKGHKDRDVTLSPRLLEVLRDYWKWRKPKTYLFPSYQRQ